MNVKMMKNRGKVELIIDGVAYQKMMCYTNSVKTEIGWLGTATRENGMFTIHDVFLLEQEVHGTTAELTTDGISKLLYEELATKENYDFILENMKVWGHSHNVMPVYPSFQDDKQMEIFEDGGYDFVIRLITNYAGEIGVTIYDYKSGFIYEDISWSVKYNDLTEGYIKQAKEKIEYYKKLIQNLEEKSLINEEQIKMEVKEKVKEKKFEFKFSKCKKNKKDKWYGETYDTRYDAYYDYTYDPYQRMEEYIDYDKALEEGAIDIDEDGVITWLD